MYDAVFFDLMGTVVYDPYLEAIEAATGLGLAEALEARDPTCWPDFELGRIDETEFTRRFFAQPSPREFDMDAFHRVRRDGYRFLPGMESLLVSLRGRVQRYIASNYPVWIDEMHTVFGFDRHFEGVYASCHLGLRKPDPAFYLAMLEASGHAAQRCLFVDDRRENCDAAAAVGLDVHVFDGAQGLREALRSIGLDG